MRSNNVYVTYIHRKKLTKFESVLDSEVVIDSKGSRTGDEGLVIVALKERTGSSSPAIKAYIIANNKGLNFQQVSKA